MAYFFNVSCFVRLNKRAKKDARKGKRKVLNSKGEKKRRALKRLLIDTDSYFSSAISLLGAEFLYYFSILIMSSWARLGLCYLKK